MIDFKTANHRLEKFVFVGTGNDAAAESTYLIHRLYLLLSESYPSVGSDFKRMVQEIVADDNGPMWELEEKA